MGVVHGKVKKWGNSLGIVVTKEVVKRKDIREGQEVELILRKPSRTDMEKVFGSLKGWKKPTKKILKEVDEELWND